MADQLVTDAQLIEAIKREGSNNRAAAVLGMNRRTIDRRVERLALKGWSPEHDMTHSVPDGFNVKGVSTLYDGDGIVRAQWVKSNADLERRKALIEESYKAMIAEMKPLPPRKETRKKYIEDTLVGYPLGDPHVGMRAWVKETGADWDLAIAQDTHRIVVRDLVARSIGSEQALLVNLGDMMHYDSMMPMTARSGNMLDADGRYNKMIRVATEVMVEFVERALQKHHKVHVINAIGNHDETGAQWLALLLEHRYHREKRVTVETTPSVFSYFRHGNNIIGVHHGHTVKKIESLPGIMATDRAKDWGECENRYWWTGHVHHEAVKELPGCTVKTFGTLATADAYAAAGGWRSRQSAYSIALNEGGEFAWERSNPKIAALNLPAWRMAA